ncbi:hypothetical protein FACS1894161_1240 [Spirochaetia bacterium]|nr:hypothetical protein FACS1894161_1240 [Spirochaetia bacterium]
MLCCFPLLSQERQAERGQPDNNVYVISSIEYRITGRTTKRALARALKLREGERFAGLEDLDRYVAGKIRELHNLRSLEAGVSTIRYTLGESPADSGQQSGSRAARPVHLEITAADTWNFIVLPEPKYDSNSGFTLSLKARDYNFLGTLSPLKLDLIWGSDDDGMDMAGVLLEMDFPFRVLNHDWNFAVIQDYRYYFDAPVYNKTAAALSVNLPFGFTTLRPGFEQGFVLHEKDNKAKNDGGYHNWYLYSKPYIDWEIPVPLEIGDFGKIIYTPGIYGNLNYQPGGDVGVYRAGPGAGFTQRLEFGKINWLGNFRQGIKIGTFNENEYDFYHKDWDNSAGISAEGHLKFSGIFGVSARVMYTRWLDNSWDRAGDTVRGYRDDALDAEQRLSVNLDFPFRLIRFVPSVWSGGKSLGIFDFEQHWSPFIDILMVDTPDQGYRFRPEDIITTAGLEIITFPLKWRSIYIRISAGWNLREWIGEGKMPSGIHREIYIGLGHYY